jgi:hypothetical protein
MEELDYFPKISKITTQILVRTLTKLRKSVLPILKNMDEGINAEL